MTIDELFRALPRIIVATVLTLFGIARIVSARRHSDAPKHEWETIAGVFLLSLAVPVATTVYLVYSNHTAHEKQFISAAAWWIAAVVSIVTFYCWSRRDQQ